MPTPKERRYIIHHTGLCLNENCVAHDTIIDRILNLIKKPKKEDPVKKIIQDQGDIVW